jgi:RimJ/RimL family protein N-acetyltransferase
VQECPGDHPALSPLFDTTLPNNPVLWAVLKGRHTGRALVDDLRDPCQCLLRTDAVLTFMSRQISQAFLDQAVTHLLDNAPVWLVWPAAGSSRLNAPKADFIIHRLEFYDHDAHSTILADWRKRLPTGLEIRPIDRHLLEQCEWRSDIEFYAGSIDNFLTNGVGFCLMRGEEITAEAYASSFGETQAEIGAITREAYRGRGYAPITCAYLIEHLGQRGYQAYWSCDADNLASIRVAHKLGFRHEKAYQILEYRPLV